MTARLATIALLVVAALLFNLTGYPLLDPDEGRNAEVAREMAATNDFLHPRLDGLPYGDKPVLFFAVTALFVKALGPTELAVRLPPLLFTLATLGLVCWWGRRRFGEQAAWVATIATGASALTLGFAHTVIMDSAVTLFVTAALIGFHEATDTDGRTDGQTVSTGPSVRPSAWCALAWIAIALGVLTKGPIALALPLMVAGPYAIWRRRLRALFDPVGVLAFLAIVLPWLRSMSDFAPGYMRYVLVTETLQRLTTPALERTAPFWYFLPILMAGTLPWFFVGLGEGRDLFRTTRGVADGRLLVYLLMWTIIPLLFFSLSQSKRPQYVLPLVVPVALMAGRTSQTDEATRSRSIRGAAIVTGLIGLALILFHGSLVDLVHHLSPNVADAAQAPAWWIGTVAAGSAIVAARWTRRTDVAILALTLPVVCIPLFSRALLKEIGKERSAAELAAAITGSAPARTEVIGIGAYPPSLPFYLGRTVTLATADGHELTSNYIQRTAGAWRLVPGSPLRPAGWWREAFQECSRPRVFVAPTGDSEARTLLSAKLPLIAETRKYVAYGPCGATDLAED